MLDRWRDKLERWRDDRATRIKRWIGGQKPVGVFVGRRLGFAHLPRSPRLIAGLVIPPQPPARRSLLLAGLFVLLAPLLAILTETPLAGLITLALIPVLAPVSILLRSAQLVLFAEHLEVQKGKRTLVLPYTLFRGARLVPGDYGDVVVIDPRGLDGVVLRQGERVVASGQAAKLALVSFVSAGELRFPDMFGSPSSEIIEILALLASAGGEPSFDENEEAERAALLGVIRKGPRTIDAPAPLLRFPPRCLICEGTRALFHTELRAFHPAWAVLAVLGVAGALDRAFVGPVCRACEADADLRMGKACRRRAAIGVLVALVCSTPLYLLPLDPFVARFMLPVTVALIGAFVGWFTGYPAGRVVRASTDWGRRTVCVPLPSEAYADETVVYSSRPRT